MAKNISKVLDGNTPTTVERWQYPNVGVHGEDGRANIGLVTIEKVERIQRQAFKQGFDEGYAKGFKLGKSDGRKSVQPEVVLVKEVMHALQSPLKDISTEVESQLIQLAISLTRQLFRREISSDPGQIVAIVRETIAVLPIHATKIRIRLHPEDYKFFTHVFEDLAEADHWQIIEDIALQRGDCIVNTDYSTVDATIEKRLSAMINNMLGGQRATDKDSTNSKIDEDDRSL